MTEPAGPARAVDYYPIGEGHAWAHDVTDHRLEGQGPVLITSRMVEVDQRGFTIDSVRQRIRYELLEDGIFKPESRYHLLKDPIETGAGWAIPVGGTVQITSTTEVVKVPAGTFDGCLVVVEELDQIHRVEWTYARGVGPVQMRVFDLRDGPPKLVIEGVLRSWALIDETAGPDGMVESAPE